MNRPLSAVPPSDYRFDRDHQSRPGRRSGGAAGGWRLEVLYLAAASIDLLWWLPWLLVILPGADQVPGARIVLWAAANLFAALLLTRLLNQRAVEDTIQRGVFIIGVGLALWLTFGLVLPLATISSQPPPLAGGKLFFPAPILTGLLLLGFWYRGQQIGGGVITPARAGFSFRVGIVALIGAALVSNDRVQHTLITLLPLFFFAGLSTNSLARAASLRVSRDMQRSAFGLGWLVFIAAIGALLSVIGAVGGLALSGTRFDSAVGIIHDLFTALLSVFGLILLPIAQFFAGLLDSVLARVQTPIGQVAALGGQLDQLARTAGPPTITAQAVLSSLPYVCGGALLIGLLLALLLVRRQSRRVGQDSEEHESLERAPFLNGWQAAARRAIDDALDRLADWSPLGSRATAVNVRRLYARLCRLAAERGFPRGPAQTPDEYRQQLNVAFPTLTAGIDQLTRAYIDVHYGELADDPAVIDAARALCDALAMLPDTADRGVKRSA